MEEKGQIKKKGRKLTTAGKGGGGVKKRGYNKIIKPVLYVQQHWTEFGTGSDYQRMYHLRLRLRVLSLILRRDRVPEKEQETNYDLVCSGQNTYTQLLNNSFQSGLNTIDETTLFCPFPYIHSFLQLLSCFYLLNSFIH